MWPGPVILPPIPPPLPLAPPPTPVSPPTAPAPRPVLVVTRWTVTDAFGNVTVYADPQSAAQAVLAAVSLGNVATLSKTERSLTQDEFNAVLLDFAHDLDRGAGVGPAVGLMVNDANGLQWSLTRRVWGFP